jgi:hypothetical protein
VSSITEDLLSFKEVAPEKEKDRNPRIASQNNKNTVIVAMITEISREIAHNIVILHLKEIEKTIIERAVMEAETRVILQVVIMNHRRMEGTGRGHLQHHRLIPPLGDTGN